METYWHRLCQNLPTAAAVEGRALAKSTGLRPSVHRYHRLWDLLKPLGKQAEGLALLSEGCRLWPRATSLKLELAQLYLAHGDGQRVTALLSLAEAQRDPACGWVVVKGALLAGKVEWVRLLAGSLAIAKLDKSAAERQCLDLCRQEDWQGAAALVRQHHGLPEPASAGAHAAATTIPQQTSAPAVAPKTPSPSFREYAGCFGVDAPQLREWLNSPDVVAAHGPWQTVVDQLTSGSGPAEVSPFLAVADVPCSLRQAATATTETRASTETSASATAKGSEAEGESAAEPMADSGAARLALVAKLLKAASRSPEAGP